MITNPETYFLSINLLYSFNGLLGRRINHFLRVSFNHDIVDPFPMFVENKIEKNTKN